MSSIDLRKYLKDEFGNSTRIIEREKHMKKIKRWKAEYKYVTTMKILTDESLKNDGNLKIQ